MDGINGVGGGLNAGGKFQMPGRKQCI